jgi:hypothetical protein
MICVPDVMLIGVELVFKMPAPAHPKEFGETPTTRAGSVAAGAVLAALTAARFAAPAPSVIAFGNTQLLLASLISATFCDVPVESFTVNGLGQAARAAVPQATVAATTAARIQILDFTVLCSCYLIIIERAMALQPVLTEKSDCSAPQGVGPPLKTPFPA